MFNRSAILTQAHRTARFHVRCQLRSKIQLPYRELFSRSLRACWRQAKLTKTAQPSMPRIDYVRRELELVPYIENFEQATARRVDLETELKQLTA